MDEWKAGHRYREHKTTMEGEKNVNLCGDAEGLATLWFVFFQHSLRKDYSH